MESSKTEILHVSKLKEYGDFHPKSNDIIETNTTTAAGSNMMIMATHNDSDSINLPGYQAQLSDDGLLHSQQKIAQSAMDFNQVINPSIETTNNEIIEGGNDISSPSTLSKKIIKVPCSSISETIGYRSSCSFQMITIPPDNAHNSNCNSYSSSHLNYCYAMRQANIGAVPLGGSTFPIATQRIQQTMEKLLQALNRHIEESNEEAYISGSSIDSSTLPTTFYHLRKNLCSVSFVSSWNNEDCIVTMNYSTPIPYFSEGEDAIDGESKVWMIQADELRKQCDITTLLLRSKKRLCVMGRRPSYIHDELIMTIGVDESTKKTYHVSLASPATPNHDCDDRINHPNFKDVALEEQIYSTRHSTRVNDTYGNTTTKESNLRRVIYQKPHDAFQHPNSNAMIIALQWILNKLNSIAQQCSYSDLSNTNTNNDDLTSSKRSTKLELLEMYCGCGAHTMPIALSGIFDMIVAVEIDQRLVDACMDNCKLNHCELNDHDNHQKRNYDNNHHVQKVTPVHVQQGDAGQWATKFLSRINRHEQESKSLPFKTKNNTSKATNKSQSWYDRNYHVLLVDPPRAGLDKAVCDMLQLGPFEHLLYISCGRKALTKDLAILDKGGFEVVDIVVTDLFPRTDAVESLVHLKRR